MATYHVQLDGGEGGETTIEAATLAEALREGIKWAADGDWSIAQEGTEEQYGGCGDVRVQVQRTDGEEDEETLYTIPTLGDLEEERMATEGEILAEQEGEFDREQLIRIDGEYFHAHPNGGSRGAWDRQDADGVWRDYPIERTRRIEASEARALLLDWGYSPSDVARMTDDD